MRPSVIEEPTPSFPQSQPSHHEQASLEEQTWMPVGIAASKVMLRLTSLMNIQDEARYLGEGV